MEVLVVYNEPTLSPHDRDRASEAGVLESVTAVRAALAGRGHRVRELGIGCVADLADALPQIPPADVVFNLFEGFEGRSRGEAEVAGLLELLGHPVTGSPAHCLALVRDKARTKWLLAGAGIPTAQFEFVPENEPTDAARLEALLATGPVIVKPAQEDGSLGIGPESIVCDFRALTRQIGIVHERYGPALVEQFVVGREFNAAVLALPELETLPLAEIEFCGTAAPGWQIVTYEAKWATGSVDDRTTPARCPARVDAATAERIAQATLAAFRLAGCRDYARVDLRLDALGRLYLLEINANPDVGPSAGFTPALAHAGIGYADFVERVVQHAVATRSAARSATAPI